MSDRFSRAMATRDGVHREMEKEEEALDELILAAYRVAFWYRAGGNPNTDEYKQLLSRLAHQVSVYEQIRTPND